MYRNKYGSYSKMETVTATTYFQPTTEKPYEFSSYGQRLFVAGILILVFISGVFGNGLVILSVFLSRRLRNVTNIFVVNLAVADLLACAFLPATITALSGPKGWPLDSQIYCTAAALIIYVTIGVSLYTLSAIALNRCFLITQSVELYQKIYGKKHVIVGMTIFLWLLPASLVCIPYGMGLNKLGYNEKYHSCTDTVSEEQGDEAEKIYDMVLAVGLFPLPTIILLVSYWKIYKHVLTHSKKLQANQEESEVLSMTADNNKPIQFGDKSYNSTGNLSESNSYASLPRSNGIEDKGSDNKEGAEPKVSRKKKKAKRKKTVKSNLSRRQVEITKNLFYVLCAFLVCITPYLILLVFDDDGPLAPFAPYAACCLMVNNCINWIIYATKHPHFKVVFRCILKCKWREIPEPVDWLRDRGEGSFCPCC